MHSTWCVVSTGYMLAIGNSDYPHHDRWPLVWGKAETNHFVTGLVSSGYMSARSSGVTDEQPGSRSESSFYVMGGLGRSLNFLEPHCYPV